MRTFHSLIESQSYLFISKRMKILTNFPPLKSSLQINTHYSTGIKSAQSLLYNFAEHIKNQTVGDLYLLLSAKDKP